MGLIKLQRAVHGRSAWAIYAFNLFKMNVYLRHNKPAKKEYGDFELTYYIEPNSAGNGIDADNGAFTNYSAFREYRKMLYAAHGSDKRIKYK